MRIRVWVWFVPKYPRGLVLCLKDSLCQILGTFLTVTKIYSKKKKKNVSIIEKCVAPSCGTFFNQKKMVKKGNVEIRVWVWLEIVLKCRGRI